MDQVEDSLSKEISRLKETLKILRGDDGCPWDKAQGLEDLASYLIDESYELQSAVASKDLKEIESELSDVIYVAIFFHLLFSLKRGTTLSALVSKANIKIIERHPHVFGSSKADNIEDSISEWEKAKKKMARGNSVMDSVPAGLPSLRYALSVSKKAVNQGFDWPDCDGILEKLNEEISELREALSKDDSDHITEEIGDIFFTVVNLARKCGIDPESAANKTTDKFIKRFRMMESRAAEEGRDLTGMNIDELEALWERSKDILRRE